MKNIFLAVVALLALTVQAQHEHHQPKNSDVQSDHSMHQSHQHNSNLEAPISVMGSHMHEKGSWMVSYRYMSMIMKDLQQGTDDISNEQAHDVGYMMTPLEMGMNMHMIGAMFAPSNKFTIMAMLNIVQNDMDMQMRNMNGMVMPFSTSSSGFGDTKIVGLYSLNQSEKGYLHGQIGVSIPTGSIDEMHLTPMSNGNEIMLPYPMQLGSGTFDTELGLTYVGKRTSFSWGHQLKGLMRLGENNNEYTLGNQYSLDNWFTVKTAKWLSLSGRLEGVIVDEISGANPELNPMMGTTADPMNSGGSFVNGGVGLNTYIFEGMQLGAEYEVPLFQDVNGIQLKQDATFTVGLLYGF